MHAALADRADPTVTVPLPSGAADGDAVRASTWSLLGALLAAPPDERALGVLRGIEADRQGPGGGLAAAWEMLRLAGSQARVEALDDEYHALFIGMGRGELVPYGSWYLTGFMMDRPLAVLRADLAALGFERQDDVREPEDHVAALCEVMALLVDEQPIETQRRFFRDHVGHWMKTFFLDLQKARTATFYRSVGHFGEQFVDFEQKYLSMPV